MKDLGIPVGHQFQNHQLGIRGDEAALRIGGVTEPLTAEDLIDELDDRIVLPGVRQASCLRSINRNVHAIPDTVRRHSRAD